MSKTLRCRGIFIILCPCFLLIITKDWKDIMKIAFSRWWHITKELFEEEIIDILITVIISSLLEIGKKIASILFLSSGKDPIHINSIKELFCNETYDDVLNIILLTLIIWGVTGLTKMLKESNIGKKNKIHTSSMFTIFILCLLWYIFKDFFAINRTTMMISGIFCISLLVILCTYFIKNKYMAVYSGRYQSDNRVA